MEYAEAVGWVAWWTPDSRRTNPGEPDLRLAGWGRVIWAELKVDGRRPTRAQRRAHLLLLAAHQEIYVWDLPGDWPEAQRILAAPQQAAAAGRQEEDSDDRN